jgi:hypothetical protein
MPPRRSARVAAEVDRATTALAPLPLSLVLDIFARLPADVRARCALVCRGWCHVLLEPSLWTRLDLSPSSGIRIRVTDAVLRGASLRARGGLTALDVSDCDRVTRAARLDVLRANAGALTRLRVLNLHPVFGISAREHFVGADELQALLAAAPRLTRCDADVYSAWEAAVRMLRNEPPFGALRVRRFAVGSDGDATGAALLPPLCAALAAHASLTCLHLCYVSLAAPAALDAVVDAALARRLQTLDLHGCRVCPASAPALARLLRGGTLRALRIAGGDMALLDAPAAALLADALRTNETLTTLTLLSLRLWHDAAATATLLGALTAHPSLRTLHCCHNGVGAHAAAVGAALGALVAANAPALTELDISGCRLGDAGMAPLVDALAANTHLRKLTCYRNDMSEAFAHDALLPAVRENKSLRELNSVGAHSYNTTPAELEAAALVDARAAAEGAGGGAQ